MTSICESILLWKCLYVACKVVRSDDNRGLLNMCESENVRHSVVSDSLRPMDCKPARIFCPCQNTGVGCHSLLQGIFLTQGLNPHLLHCTEIFFTV